MTKDEYYKISKEQKLALRCPCLSTCARYRFTAFLVGRACYNPRAQDYEGAMREMGILGKDEEIEKMLEAGEPVTTIGGSRSFWVNNGCPEFFLHSHEHKMSGMKDLAVHEYSYDEEYRGEKFIPGESRHYTECAEYALHLSKKGKLKSRKKISPKLRAELQKEINSECPFCYDAQVGHFQIHHIDENPENNRAENLLMLCAICHSKITKGDISLGTVKEKKETISSQNCLIECASISIDSSNCSWKNYDEPNAFYDARNGKSRFPLLQFSIINNSKKTVLFTEIDLKAKYLPSGLSGIPEPYKLKSIDAYKVLLPLGAEISKLRLDNEVVIQSGQAIKFTVELYSINNGENYPPNERMVLFFTFNFGSVGQISSANIYLNCTNESSDLKIYHIS